ncbi:transglycosylase SLT domain-containing protein [Macrococcoides caseolyticum]|uniref:transglycosylase SLT domain-containing protein n=1 Tax=Macrococcoides caseolyticum TaxID=69966 RepID=UPI001F29960E|nr:transglycosylase SLT domain-containing protein [Macrococcus caseolyticus]MCE4956810.1 transglycosylase SLT domain-containing protein [Macrococcus caseolyticus]
MKKAILTSSLALALGVTGVAGSNQAQASENTQEAKVDFNQLAELANNNDASLNESPVHAGAYNYSFVKDGFQYDFESDGVYWKWAYKYTGAADTVLSKTAKAVEVAPQAPAQAAAPVQQTTYAAPVAQNTYKAPVTQNTAKTYTAPVAKTSYQTSGIRLANGNTAGSVGSQAAQEMARRTGVPASTWEHIIARESNGQVNAYNPSGASGLFQTMPGWGSTATVSDQINAATKAYRAQGLSAWGF